MRISDDKFADAAAEAVTHDGRRVDVWFVYPHYDVVHSEGEKPFAYAPVDVGEFVDERRAYRPLADTPTLFLDFARTATSELTEDIWLEWIHRYGVLGLSAHRTQFMRYKGQRGGSGESQQLFEHCVKEAHLALRLYELATSPYGPNASDIATLIQSSRYGSGVHDHALQDNGSAAKHALLLAHVIVQEVLNDHTFAVLYPTDPSERCYARSWGFRTLLGAMFLQMMWLMTATDRVRRCDGPGCSVVIAFDTPTLTPAGTIKNDRSMGYRPRRDKKYCSPACKQARYRRNQRR